MIEATALSVRAYGHWILVKPSKENLERTPGGLFLPETAQEEARKQMTMTGVVAQVGHGQWIGEKRVPMDVCVGQRIAYQKAMPIILGGVPYDVLRDADVIAVLESTESIQG